MPTEIYNLADHPTDVPAFPGAPLGRLRGDTGNDADGFDPHGNLAPSGELATSLLKGVLCGVDPALEAVNVPNGRYVPGLSEGAVVEVPARADASGLHPASMAPLPEGILGLLRPQTSINGLLIDAFANGCRRTLLQALLLDPTTHSYRAAVHTLDEMFRLQQDVLPQMKW